MNADTNKPLKADSGCTCLAELSDVGEKLKGVNDKLGVIDGRFSNLNTQLQEQFGKIMNTLMKLKNVAKPKDVKNPY